MTNTSTRNAMRFDLKGADVVAAQNAEDVYDQVALLLRGAITAGKMGSTTVLVPTVEDSTAYKEAMARRGRSFGVRIEAFDVWLADMWELWGDGRRMVDSPTRTTACAALLNSSDTLPASPGTIGLMAKLAAGYLPHILAVAPMAADLTDNERAMVQLLQEYADLIMRRNYIEPCQAALALPQLLDPSTTLIAAGFDEDGLSPAQKTLLAGTGATVVLNSRSAPPTGPRTQELQQLLAALYHPQAFGTVAAGGSVRLAFSTGASAEERCITDLLKDLSNQHPSWEAALAAKDPVALFDAVAGDLAAAGLRPSLKAKRPVLETDAGKLLLQLRDVLAAKTLPEMRTAEDLALNGVVDAWFRRAFQADKALRANRLSGPAELASALEERLPTPWADAIALLAQGSFSEAFRAMAAVVTSSYRLPEGYRTEQGLALQVMSRFAAQAEAELLPLELVAGAMKDEDVEVALDACSDGCALRVCFMSLEDAAALQPSSVDALVACQMTAEDRAVRQRRSSVNSLMAKLGASMEVDPLARARRNWHDAVAVARKLVVIERPLNDAESNPAYPAAVALETADCYRAAGSRDGDAAKELGIPDALLPCASILDETRFLYAAAGTEEQPVRLEDEVPLTGRLSPDLGQLVCLPPSSKPAGGEPLLSASALELYLGCPYSWFADRRLKLDTPDEEVGHREKGSFAHEVLERFQQALEERGIPRVDPGNLEPCRQLMGEVFDQALEEQYSREPHSYESRYVPVTAMEKEEAASLRKEMLEGLGTHAAIFPRFKPQYHEWAFGQDGDVEYAGIRLQGRIDRIDVDDQGNAIIIDYKASAIGPKALAALTPSPDGTGIALPQKVQVFVYAEVARRVLGLNPVGAVYLTTAGDSVAGVIDITKVELGNLEDLPVSRSALLTAPLEADEQEANEEGVDELPEPLAFDEMLRMLETLMRGPAEALVSGLIEPHPAGEWACKHCPAAYTCEESQQNE